MVTSSGHNTCHLSVWSSVWIASTFILEGAGVGRMVINNHWTRLSKNIVFCQRQADQLIAEAFAFGK